MINNSVHKGDELVGFRCHHCGEMAQRMWGTTCNACRREEERHQEMLKAMKN